MSKSVVIKVVLTSAEAMAFAQFLKRSTYNDYRSNSIDDAEAYHMIAAGGQIRKALAESGYAPR
jgi:hypothetical protein